jgi:hypothetical protein
LVCLRGERWIAGYAGVARAIASASASQPTPAWLPFAARTRELDACRGDAEEQRRGDDDPDEARPGPRATCIQVPVRRAFSGRAAGKSARFPPARSDALVAGLSINERL